ncbi:hypothetical protein LNQ52_18820 [Klebsiella pneumoniae subsp. pneumoniae]|nr:hypothetical protein [Klebsiella pneumoniae subsp. pneumoniae]
MVFVDVRGFDAVIELDMGAQLYREIETLFSPSAAQSSTRWILSRLMRSGGPVALCHQQTLIHVDFTCP